jgi:acylphosphatase
MKTYHYIVQGRVQGVAFRYSTVRAAHSNSITGFVRNLPNGDVEVYAQGAPENIRQFEQFLHKGPPLARVVKVIGESFEKDLIYEGFEIF